MIALSKYLCAAVTSARSNLAYWGEVVTRGIFLAILLYIFLCLWRATYAQTGATHLGGFTLAQMLWYLAMTESIYLSMPRVALAVDEDVRTGALAVQLVRPLSYPLYQLSTNLGDRTVRFVMNVLISSAIALVAVGPISLTLPGLAIFIVSLPLAFVLDFLVYFLIGLAAFWLEDTSGLTLIYSRLTMILGGALIPIDLYPDLLKTVARGLPFYCVVYGPAHLFIRPEPGFLLETLARQGVAVCLLSLVVVLVYRQGLRRVSLQGG